MVTEIFAHRGASCSAPENTLLAFNLAYKKGAEGIETDVHLTKDNVPILIHDATLDRTTDGKGYVKDYTWEQLKIFNAGYSFSKTEVETPIMSLEELLRWAKNKNIRINIELKNNKFDYPNMENIIYGMINDYQLKERTILSTFNQESITRLKNWNENIELALLVSKKQKGIVSLAKTIGANALHIKFNLLNKRIVKECHKHQMPIRVFTVNKKSAMYKCYELGCDGIFTDKPKQAKWVRMLFKSGIK